jgi:hypothetical protein
MKKYNKPVSTVEIETKNASAKGGDFGGGFAKGFMGGATPIGGSLAHEYIKIEK